MTPSEYLKKLQSEAAAFASRSSHRDPHYHYGIRGWVDDNSSVARALRGLESESS